VTDPNTLHQHKDRPVPWITRWSGEVSFDKYQMTIERTGVRLHYPDGNENREANGVLWKREGITRAGSPQYSQINTYRQRAAMRKRLCQVCGTKINERPIRWLMNEKALTPQEDGTAITMSAPTCESCIPLALSVCPHLKSEPTIILKVLDYEPWGVYGQAVHLDPETGKAQDLRGVYIEYANPPIELTALVAFQEVVRLTKYVKE